MNIKPLALVVPMLLAAGTVSAEELYKNDSNTVELSGWAKAYGSYIDGDVESKNKDTHVETDAQLKVKATHKINEVSKVIGSFAINTTPSSVDDRKAEFGDIKFEYDHAIYGNLSLGDTGDSFGAIKKGEAGEGSNFYSVSQGGVNGQGIRYKKTLGSLALSANYETDNDTQNKAHNFATSLSFNQDIFSIAAAFGSDGDKAISAGVGSDVRLGNLKLGAAFVSFENAGSITVNDSLEISLAGTENDGDTYALAATYTIGDAKVYGSAQAIEGTFEGKDFDGSTFYAGVDYMITDSITTWVVAQTGEIDTSGDKKDATQFKFGAKYSF